MPVESIRLEPKRPEINAVLLNALVTFAAENMPGGLSDAERLVALQVGDAALTGKRIVVEGP